MSAIPIAQVIAMALAGSAAQAVGIRNLYLASAALLVAIAVFGYFRLERLAR